MFYAEQPANQLSESYSMDIDNADVEIDNLEVRILDGSGPPDV